MSESVGRGRVVLAVICLLIAFPIWLLGLNRHAVLTAGQPNLSRAWRLSRRAMGRQPGKATVLALARILIFIACAINLHLVISFGFWIAEELGGLDVTFLALQISLSNPLYLLVLTGVTWWLLAPYSEAVSYLFLVDARTRYEGLDLWYRIEQLFPVSRVAKAGALLLALGAGLFLAGPACASERLKAVQQARRDVATVKSQVEKANPYPGGMHWRPRLMEVGKLLDPTENSGGRYRWYFQTVATFARSNDRANGAKLLDDILQRLGLVEASLQWQPRPPEGDEPDAEDVRGTVPQGAKQPRRKKGSTPSKGNRGQGEQPAPGEDNVPQQQGQGDGPDNLNPRDGGGDAGDGAVEQGPAPADVRKLVPPGRGPVDKGGPRDAPRRPPEPQQQPPRQVEQDDPLPPPDRAPAPAMMPAVAVAPALGGLGQVCVFFCLVLIIAAVLGGIVMAIYHWRKSRPATKQLQQGTSGPAALEAVLEEPDKQNVASLWREADALARSGRFLEAVRTLYLAVLALLHQSGLIRYERTRTNGEYADHLRRKRVPVHPPFVSLTGLFEVKWYGERACQDRDYDTCRGLAETIESGVKSRGAA
jgi:hypothetical protein